MDINIRFDPTLDEFYHLHLLMAGRTGVYKYASPATLLALVLETAVTMVIALLADFSVYAVLLFSVLIVMLLAVFVLQYVVLPAKIRKHTRQFIDLSGTHEYAISDQGVTGRDERGTSTMPWGKYVKWVEDDTVLALFQTDATVSLIPKRCLSAGQMQDIRKALADAGVPPQKIRRIGTIVWTVIIVLLLPPVVCLLAILMAYTRYFFPGS
jgi:hypothetical protein